MTGIAPEPLRPPAEGVPDSLPERDRGMDGAPDEVRDAERPARSPPDSLPRDENDPTPRP